MGRDRLHRPMTTEQNLKKLVYKGEIDLSLGEGRSRAHNLHLGGKAMTTGLIHQSKDCYQRVAHIEYPDDRYG